MRVGVGGALLLLVPEAIDGGRVDDYRGCKELGAGPRRSVDLAILVGRVDR